MTAATMGISVATARLSSDQQWQLSTMNTGEMATASENTTMAQSPATRPEDLGVTPWYVENHRQRSGPDAQWTGQVDRGSFPSYAHAAREPFDKSEVNSTRNSSIESEIPRGKQSGVFRKAYMDLTDAIALLDETCPNQDVSPSLTPRTPRTPLTPYPQSKRARSKSSDNSSNYSTDRLSDRSLDVSKNVDKEKKRPFLKKIGLSKTEDKPFLAKLAPKIAGKPYLEKIGPSKAVERPFLAKIGSSRTLDLPSPEKFTFDTGCNTEHAQKRMLKTDSLSVMEGSCVTKFTTLHRQSAKGFLLKMYSFETEDLDETSNKINMRGDPLRGASAEGVLESGPSSLPTNVNKEGCQIPKTNLECRPVNETELVKCRVTTSEEIISFSLNSEKLRVVNSCENTPMRKSISKTVPSQSTQLRKDVLCSSAARRNGDKSADMSVKKPAMEGTKDKTQGTSNINRNSAFSLTEALRRTSEDYPNRLNGNRESWSGNNCNKQIQFERRGISSDNLLSKSNVESLSTPNSQIVSGIADAKEAQSEDYLVGHLMQKYTDGKHLKEKENNPDVTCQVPDETYAAFKRRTRRYYWGMDRQYPFSRRIDPTRTRSLAEFDRDCALADKAETQSRTSTSWEATREEKKAVGPRSVLRKQERIDQLGDQEADINASLRHRPVPHEPSQETMKLLAELRKTKSLLKTANYEKNIELDKNDQRLPKKILLTDKEFCLSIERENSVRRSSRTINISALNASLASKTEDNKSTAKYEIANADVSSGHLGIVGPALFEKRCLSLDYADEEKSQKSETNGVSLTSAENLPSESQGTVGCIDLTILAEASSHSSDTFRMPSQDMESELGEIEKETTDSINEEPSVNKLMTDHEKNVTNIYGDGNDKNEDSGDIIKEAESNKLDDVDSIVSQKKDAVMVCIQEQLDLDQSKATDRHRYSEVDIAIPVDQKNGDSPMKIIQMEGRTSDLYEIISPRSTPFRIKKRLGKISVEEAVKTESFPLSSKLDCQTVTVQKRTKCFPL